MNLLEFKACTWKWWNYCWQSSLSMKLLEYKAFPWNWWNWEDLKSFKNLWKDWKDFERFEKIWKDLKRFEKIWKDLKRFEKIWKDFFKRIETKRVENSWNELTRGSEFISVLFLFDICQFVTKLNTVSKNWQELTKQWH